jgi:hypothetical protein
MSSKSRCAAHSCLETCVPSNRLARCTFDKVMQVAANKGWSRSNLLWGDFWNWPSAAAAMLGPAPSRRGAPVPGRAVLRRCLAEVAKPPGKSCPLFELPVGLQAACIQHKLLHDPQTPRAAPAPRSPRPGGLLKKRKQQAVLAMANDLFHWRGGRAKNQAAGGHSFEHHQDKMKG